MRVAFLDLEFTRKIEEKSFINEIIEASMITLPVKEEYKVNNKGIIMSRFSIEDKNEEKIAFFVKPSKNKILSDEVIKYTLVSQKDVDNAISLSDAINKLYNYIKSNDIIRIYIYSSYCKNLLVGAKRILNSKLDKKINYIINLLVDIGYYAEIAKKRIDLKLKRIYNNDTKYLLERLKIKKELSLSDTYLVLMNQIEINKKYKNKSLNDARLIKDIFLSDDASLQIERKNLIIFVNKRREKLYSKIIKSQEMLEWICNSQTVDELEKYKGEDVYSIIKSIAFISNEFKVKIIENPNIRVQSISEEDPWLIMYKTTRELGKDIKNSWGLNIRTVDDCIKLLSVKEENENKQKLEADLISLLMNSNDNFLKFEEDIKDLKIDILEKISERCQEIIRNYKGHSLDVYSTKLNIINNKIYKIKE